MANTKSAAKSARQSERRRSHNASVLTALKTSQKKARTAIAGNDPEAAKAAYQAFTAAADKAAKRGIIHSNVADRRKGRLNKALAAATAAK
jgi:small subunit ribosomal protein S20